MLRIKEFAMTGGIVLGFFTILLSVLEVLGIKLIGLHHVLVGGLAGFSVTWVGAIVGGVYAFLIGYLLFYAIAYVYGRLE